MDNTRGPTKDTFEKDSSQVTSSSVDTTTTATTTATATATRLSIFGIMHSLWKTPTTSSPSDANVEKEANVSSMQSSRESLKITKNAEIPECSKILETVANPVKPVNIQKDTYATAKKILVNATRNHFEDKSAHAAILKDSVTSCTGNIEASSVQNDNISHELSLEDASDLDGLMRLISPEQAEVGSKETIVSQTLVEKRSDGKVDTLPQNNNTNKTPPEENMDVDIPDQRVADINSEQCQSSVLQSKQDNGSFVPCKIFDVKSLGYCTYCFTADHVHEDIHKEASCCFTDCPPHYWPSSWDTVKALSYRHTTCASCNFSSEQVSELADHIATAHVSEGTASSGEEAALDTLVVDGAPSLPSPLNDSSCSVQRNGGSLSQSPATLANTPGSSMAIHIDDLSTVEKVDIDAQARVPSTAKDVMLDNKPKIRRQRGRKRRLNSSSDEDENKPTRLNQSLTRRYFKCGFCWVVTPDIKLILQHYIHVHDVNMLLICKPCFFVSHQRLSLEKHWKKFHRRNQKKPEFLFTEKDDNVDLSSLIRAGCTVVPDVAQNEVEHNAANHNNYLLEKLAKFGMKCQLCTEYETKYRSCIVTHYETKHWTGISETMVNLAADTTSYRCVTCHAVEESRRQIAVHYVQKHTTAIPTLECELCEVSIAEASRMKQHLNSERHKEFYRRSLRCTKCLFATLSKKKLTQHATDHLPSFKCEKCDFVTKVRSALSKHVATHRIVKDANGLYHCDECEFSSPNKYQLDRHYSLNHGVNSGKSIPCELCDFVAAGANGYAIHIRSHRAAELGVSAKDMWKCQYCDKKSLTQANFETHKNACLVRRNLE